LFNQLMPELSQPPPSRRPLSLEQQVALTTSAETALVLEAATLEPDLPTNKRTVVRIAKTLTYGQGGVVHVTALAIHERRVNPPIGFEKRLGEQVRGIPSEYGQLALTSVVGEVCLQDRNHSGMREMYRIWNLESESDAPEDRWSAIIRTHEDLGSHTLRNVPGPPILDQMIALRDSPSPLERTKPVDSSFGPLGASGPVVLDAIGAIKLELLIARTCDTLE
jgi:hypothetical protein